MDLLAIFGVGTNLMFSLGIIFIIVFTLFYLRQRLSDYDSKLKDMIQIISGLNNEIKTIKATINQPGTGFDNVNHYSQHDNGESKKVELTANNYTNVVECDEIGEEELYVKLSEENSDEEDDSDDEDGSYDDDSDEEEEEEDETENVKEIVGLENDLEKEVSSLLEKNENTRVVDLSEVVEEIQNETDEDINLTKMTISELRDYAVNKGIAIDPKIKKKTELIELLETTI